MNDEEFVHKFLDKNYALSIKFNLLYIVDNFNRQEIEVSKFQYTFNIIFGDWVCDGAKSNYEFFLNWVEKQKSNISNDIIDYLNDSNIILDFDKWVVKKNNIEITDDFIIKKFSDRYDENLVEHLYSIWYYDKICEATEKMMNIW